MIDVTSDSHLQGTGEGFEDTLYLVVLVLPLGLNVQIHLGCIAERFEEM